MLIQMSEDFKNKIIQGLIDDEIVIEYKNSTYLTFNQLELEVGSKKIHFKKDGQSVITIKLNEKIKPGDTIVLNDVLGVIEFKVS